MKAFPLSALLALALCSAASAVQTNYIWQFLNPNDYVYSDPRKIEVAGGTARLRLQANRNIHGSIPIYFTNTTAREQVSIGPVASVALLSSGNQYQPYGTYVSRVLDGGLNNEWQAFFTRVSNRDSGRALLGIPETTSGLVAFYHLDNSWVDLVTGQSATPQGTAQFTPYAKYGTHAAYFDGTSSAQLYNQTLLNGLGQCTIMCFVRLRAYSINGGIVAARGGVLNGFNQSSSSSGKIAFYINSGAVSSSSTLETNRWYFIVGSYNRSQAPTFNLYVNGVLDSSYNQDRGSIAQDDYFRLGWDDGATRSKADIDEVAICNRALTATEIKTISDRALASLGFRLRSGSTLPLTGDFLGPNGATDDYFIVESVPITASSVVQPNDQYVQYKAYFASDSFRSPFLEAAGLYGSAAVEIDSTFGDFLRGSFESNTTNLPDRIDTPYVALAKRANGGYLPLGYYTSRVLDGGAGVTWGRLSWGLRGALTNDLLNLEGLWHLDGNWADSANIPVKHSGIPYFVGTTNAAKLGTGSAVFNGTTSHAEISGLSASLLTIEFWLNDENPNDGILELVDNSTYLKLTNGLVTPVNFSGGTPTVYVNGREKAPLAVGWNHVAVVLQQGLVSSLLNVGEANNDYLEGQLDELAVYSRQLTKAEINSHYVAGRRTVAGKVKLQVRSDSVNPPRGPFVGPDGSSTNAYFEDFVGTLLPLAVRTNQYLQYRAYLEGDGNATPALEDVKIVYNTVNSYLDDTPEEFAPGDFAGGTKLVGDEINLRDLNTAGPANMKSEVTATILSVWHMDETTWGSVLDSVGGKHGTAEGDAQPSADAHVGTRSGAFDGTGDDVVMQAPSVGSGDFTVMGWAKTLLMNRSAIFSAYAAGPHYTLEFNGDGSGVSVGTAAFVVRDGSTTYSVAARGLALNDGAWHHIAGVRNGRQIHIYVDGVLAASTFISPTFGSVDSSQAWIGRYGTLNLFFNGLIDEVAVVGRAMTDGEIAGQAAAGLTTLERGTFTGPVLDAGQLSIWERLVWSADAPYGKAQQGGDPDIMGLWHLDAAPSSVTPDGSGWGNPGTLTAGAALSTGGKFSNCVSFAENADQVVVINDNPNGSLDPLQFTIEAWIYPEDVADRVIFDKISGTGYRLALDASGRPTFWVNGTTCTSYETIRGRKWTHIAGVYDSKWLRLYVNGAMKAKVALIGAAVDNGGYARIGLGYNGQGDFYGKIDEVFLYARPLGPEEILDRYRAGVVTLKMQVRQAGAGSPAPFLGPSGTTNDYFLDQDSTLYGAVPWIALTNLFQYKAVLATEDFRWGPRLQGIRVDNSSYAQDKPWLMPGSGNTPAFPGELISFTNTIVTNTEAAVRYQISGDDGATWYWWNNGMRSWEALPDYGTNTEAGWTFANQSTEVRQNITNFYVEHYAKTGGVFRWRMYMRSGGLDPVAVTNVELRMAAGRIVVTVPNGIEVGTNAWVVGVTNTIRWETAGNVGTNLTIKFSSDGGLTYQTIATGVPNTGSYAWLTPYGGQGTEYLNCRILIEDAAESRYVFDASDNPFQLVHRFRLVTPNGGEKWYIGQTNRVVWQSPPNMGTKAWVYHNLNGATNQWLFLAEVDNQAGPSNYYDWVPTLTNPAILSEQARMRITLQGGAPLYSDISDADYTLAGIRITRPFAGEGWRRGTTNSIVWKSAGELSGAVDISFAEDGVSFPGSPNIVESYPNITGTNAYVWTVTAANPTPVARIRIRSRGDALITAVSDPFTIADIDIKSPLQFDVWEANRTNVIRWTAGGAGSSVNLYYSTDDGSNWLGIVGGYTNVEFPTTNTYPWLVPLQPGDKTRIKVESVEKAGLFAVSEAFSIAGIRLTEPNGGETWRLGQPHQITWDQAASGGGALLQFSVDNGGTFTNIGGPGYPLAVRSFDYSPTFPSMRARARIQASDAGKTNISDTSDGFFTVAGVKVTKPASNSVYIMGQAVPSGLEWYSAGIGDQFADVTYAPADGAPTIITNDTPNKETYPGDNARDWTPLLTMDPSDNARVSVFVQSGTNSFLALSDRFTLRGVRITQPGSGGVFRIGQTETVVWMNAGFEGSAGATLFLSTDGGATFGPSLLPFAPLLTLKQTDWDIDAATTPTTNGVLRLTVTNSIYSFSAYSPRFTLRGIKMVTPGTGNVWRIGATNAISFLAAGVPALANIYYSPDGGATYDATPVGANISVSNGLNRFDWVAEVTRNPSTNARIKVQAVGQPDVAVSAPFTLGGIRVTKPTATDIWAVGETNRIEWISIGLSGTNSIALVRGDGSVQVSVTNSVTGGFYEWPVPVAAVGTNLRIRVTDAGGYAAFSEFFQIVIEPTIKITAPQPGEYWRNSETYKIVWSKAGTMPDTFDVSYSFNNFATETPVSGVPVFTNGRYELSWALSDPSKLGKAKIRVVNTARTNIVDVSQDFYLVAKFELRDPNNGESFYALRPTLVNWFTWGDATNIELYYSTDLVRRTNRWVKINTGGPIAGRGHMDVSPYLWTVADTNSPVVWIRVQDATYTTMFEPGVVGPFDDCDVPFTINYYTITWHVYDALTSNTLDRLSVVDSSGWSESGLNSSPNIVRQYPYGLFDTIWSREFFYDYVVFNWTPEPSRTINVPMNRSEIEPNYKVMANFVFDTTAGVFRVTSWLERSGRVLPDPVSCTIFVYDSDGGEVARLESTTPEPTGVFWQELPAWLDKGRVFFAKVDIKYSGVVYSSGVTFNLRVPSEQEQLQQILDAANAASSNAILASSSAVAASSNVLDLAAAQADFRAATSAKLDLLTNVTALIRTGVTNIQDRIGILSTQAISRLDLLTNAIGVIGPGESNVLQRLEALRASEGAASVARILTRPTTVKVGQPVPVLYRSQDGVSPSVLISNVLTAATWNGGAMTPVGGGIYEASLTATWGLGNFVITCADATGSDSMVLRVTASDIDDLAVVLQAVSGQVSTIELTVTNMSRSVLRVETMVQDMTGLVSAIDVLTNANWAALDSLGAVGALLTNISAGVSNLDQRMNWADITRILSGVTNLEVSVAAVSTNLNQLSGTLSGVNWASLTNLDVILTNSQAILSGVADVRTAIGALTNLDEVVSILTNVDWGAISNISELGSGVTNILTRVTDLQGRINWTNVTATLAGVSNIQSTLAGVNFGLLTNTYAGVTNLQSVVKWSDIATILTGVTSLQDRVNWGDVTNILVGVQDVQAALGALTNLDEVTSVLTNVDWGAISNITDLATGVTNILGRVEDLQGRINWTNVTDTLAGVSNVQTLLATVYTGVTNLQATVRWSDITTILTNVTNLQARVNWADVTNMSAKVDGLQSSIGALTNLDEVVSILTNVDWGAISNISELGTGVTNILGRVTDLQGRINWTNVTDTLAGVSNIQSRLAGVNFTLLTNAYTGVTNLQSVIRWSDVTATLAAATNIQRGVTNVYDALTNLSARVNWGDITNIVAGMDEVLQTLGGLTNLDQVASVLTNVDWGAISNISDMATDVTNILTLVQGIDGVVGGLTNLEEATAVLTGVNWTAIGDLGDLGATTSNTLARVTELQGRINWTNVTATLAGVSNIQSRLAGVDFALLTNAYIGVTSLQARVDWADVTNVLAKVTEVQATLGGLTNLDEVTSVLTNVDWGAISNISALASGTTNILAGVTELRSRINWTNVTDTLAGVSNIQQRLAGVDFALLTNAYVGVTSLQARVNWADVTNVLARVTEVQATLGGLTNLDEVAATLTGVNWEAIGDLGQLGATASNTLARVIDLQGRINWTNVVDTLAGVSNIQQRLAGVDFALLTNAYAGITNLQATIKWADVTNILAGVTSLQARVNWADVTNVVAKVTAVQTTLGGLTNLDQVVSVLTNVDWGAVSNISALSSGQAAILAGVSNVQGRLDGVDFGLLTNAYMGITNLQARMNWADITNLVARVGEIQASLGSLTNLDAAVTQLTNLNWSALDGLGALSGTASNILDAVGDLQGRVQWGDISNLLDQVAFLGVVVTNIESQTSALDLTGLTDALTAVVDLSDVVNQTYEAVQGLDTTAFTNLAGVAGDVAAIRDQTEQMSWAFGAVGFASNVINSLAGAVGTPLDGAAADTLFGRLAALVGDLAEIGADAADAADKSRSARTEAQGAASRVQQLKSELGEGNLGTMTESLTAIREALVKAQTSLDQIPSRITTTRLSDSMEEVRQKINEWGKAVGAPGDLLTEPTAGGPVKADVEALNKGLAETKAMMEAVRLLMDQAVHQPVVVQWWEGAE